MTHDPETGTIFGTRFLAPFSWTSAMGIMCEQYAKVSIGITIDF